MIIDNFFIVKKLIMSDIIDLSIPEFLNSSNQKRELNNLFEYWQRMYNNYYVHLIDQYERYNNRISLLEQIKQVPTEEQCEFPYHEEGAIKLVHDFLFQIQQYFYGSYHKTNNYLRYKIRQVKLQNGILRRIISQQRKYINKLEDLEEEDEEETTPIRDSISLPAIAKYIEVI